jgi:YbbR domain-containing protein
VRRLLGRIVHNWPLKLAAVGLATLMYGGLALSQNSQTYQGAIPVQVINQPNKTVMTPSTPDPVILVRYFAPNGVPVATSTFLATIDLAGLESQVGGVVSVPIQVTTPDTRIRVLGYEPRFAIFQLDRLVSQPDIPVKVQYGTVPDGLTLGTTTIDPPSVTVSGAASIVAKVDAVRADVTIQSTGIDVDEDVKLIPVDKLGNALSPLDVTPGTARVKIQVVPTGKTRTLPVFPDIVGSPAAGFEIGSVTIDPQVALVAGDADALAKLVRVDTSPILMNGVTANESVTVPLALPPGIVEVGDQPVTVTIEVNQVTATRTYTVGVHMVGARSDLTYAAAVNSVILTIGGSTAALDRLSGSSLVADLDVTGKEPGTYEVPVTANLPAGTTLVAASPASIKVTITGPATSPGTSPESSASAAPSPSGG